ncbi:ATPase, AAA-type, core [Canna indica]|uniref:ATPase, AAA-type, core n=1 Tax=Canna indica TaxID=4628 RepID=A0AAQ3K1L4_9LILI|nr:ATPase, AAA-type, core [Canna indica]
MRVSVDKVVGFALSYHFKLNKSEALSKDSKLLISLHRKDVATENEFEKDFSRIGQLTKLFGEGEKYVKAVFTLASKISPSVIFVDEDAMLNKISMLDTPSHLKHWDEVKLTQSIGASEIRREGSPPKLFAKNGARKVGEDGL